MGLQKNFDLRPNSTEQRMEIVFSKIAKSQMHNPRRWTLNNNAIGKIRILADDHQLAPAGEFPHFRIRRLEPTFEMGTTGRLGENCMCCGRFSSKRKPFRQSPQWRNDCPLHERHNPGTPEYLREQGLDTLEEPPQRNHRLPETLKSSGPRCVCHEQRGGHCRHPG